MSSASESLIPHIDLNKANAINVNKQTFLKSVFGANGMLCSDEEVDHEIIIVIPFRSKVKISGLRLVSRSAPSSSANASGVLEYHVFVNLPNLTFDDANDVTPTQTVTLTKQQVEEGYLVPTKFAKFQSVDSLTIFIKKNQDDSDVTFLNSIDLTGSLNAESDMSNLKKSG